MMMEVPPTPYEKYMVSVHSHPTSGLSASSTHVGYEKVVEYLGTKAQNSGWIKIQKSNG
jgi:hypothetical protein